MYDRVFGGIHGIEGALDGIAQVTQRGEVVDSESDIVEEGNLLVVIAASGLTGEYLVELDNREVFRLLLDFTFDAGLLWELYEDLGLVQDGALQLGLARAVTANGIEVDARGDVALSQNLVLSLVCRLQAVACCEHPLICNQRSGAVTAEAEHPKEAQEVLDLLATDFASTWRARGFTPAE